MTSFLQGWKDPETGKEVNSGRMNLGVVTLNLPRIAMESKGDKDLFWQIFREKVQTAHEALQIKAKRCTEAVPDNAPILYEYGAFGKRLNAEDNVNDLFKNGRCTISLGYIGLYEVVPSFTDQTGNTMKKLINLQLILLKNFMTIVLSGKKKIQIITTTVFTQLQVKV